jgi:hypothetical protein
VQAVGAACVAEALRILRRDEFHCAVLDLALPWSTGWSPSPSCGPWRPKCRLFF